jgi:hypothetical protein
LANNWFYSRDGQTHGPVSSGEIKRLAASGQLQPQDLLWPDNADPGSAVVACTAVPFSARQPVVLPPAKAAPAPEPPPAVQPVSPAASPPLAVPVAGPILLALPIMVEQAAAPVTTPLPADTQAPSPPPASEPVPVEKPVRTPAITPLPVALASRRDDSPPEETGYDAQTGRILDAVRFTSWQRDQARKRQEELAGRPTTPLLEVYLQAKKDVERWVDGEQNRDLVVAGDLEVIREDGRLLDVLRPYRCWGPGLMEKLWQHLAFVVENRRRFYASGL